MWIPAFAVATLLITGIAVLLNSQPRERSCVVCGEPLGAAQLDCPACNRGR